MMRLTHALPLAVIFTAVLAATPASAADMDHGKKLVHQRCQICHQLVKDKKKIGPSLFDVVGRKAGTESYYTYSKALKDSGLTWDDATLDKWIENPHKLVKGTKMSFPGIKKADQRADIIAYLKTLK